MKPLKTAQTLMTIVCVLPPDDDTSTWRKLTYIAFGWVAVFFHIIGLMASFAFVWKFSSTDFAKSVYVFCIFLLIFSAIYAYLIIFCLRHRIANIFERLHAIHDNCKFFFFYSSFIDKIILKKYSIKYAINFIKIR